MTKDAPAEGELEAQGGGGSDLVVHRFDDFEEGDQFQQSFDRNEAPDREIGDELEPAPTSPAAARTAEEDDGYVCSHGNR